MKALSLLCTAALATAILPPAFGSPRRDYPFQPVPFTAVHLTDSFWAPRIETNRLTTIPYAFEQCEKTGRVDNFVRASSVLHGGIITDLHAPGYPFDDSDVYKIMEGASYDLAVAPDPRMKDYMAELTSIISGAQEPDGYLYTARTIDPAHPHAWSGAKRWEKEVDLSHELYNAGHLFEAAAANYQATGDRHLLDVALKEADLLCATFGPEANKVHGVWPGHEVVEMGLAKLYRVTGESKYLRLAKYFIDYRGPCGDDYHQSRIKPVNESRAVGHAVRAGYLYSGMADVAALTGARDYVRAIDRIWNDVAGTKLYVTGGIGAIPDGEKFGPAYFLPNKTAYCETCAAVANDFWNERLFLLHGDAQYVDVLERALYNGLLSGVSLDGKGFFYVNPLEADGAVARSPWFGCACCPGNITRFLPSLPGYLYAQSGKDLYVNLYAANEAEIKIGNRAVKITEETRYPWDGAVKLTVHPDEPARFTIKLRVPGWARNEAAPGGLYRFVEHSDAEPTLKVNDGTQPIKLERGYVSLKRKWKDGDTIYLEIPMPVRRIVANQAVEADRGRVALQRGPIVYCLESTDNSGMDVRSFALPANEEMRAGFEPGLLHGVEVLRGTNFQAIPYYAWANRGKSEMAVWMRSSEAR